jgi:heme oxygenase
MKLIATTSFRLAILPSGSKHVERGTPFSIGGDLPPEKLSKDDYKIYSALLDARRICDPNSDEGRQISAEIERTKESEKEKQKQNKKTDRQNWHKKPVGIFVITVLAGLILWIITEILTHLFPKLLHS